MRAVIPWILVSLLAAGCCCPCGTYSGDLENALSDSGENLDSVEAPSNKKEPTPESSVDSRNENPNSEPSPKPTATTPDIIQPAIPKHEFHQARSGRRSQIRAIVDSKERSESEWKSLAELVAKQYSASQLLVMFFDDESALDAWDGTGLLRDSDWASWRAQVPVDYGSAQSVRIVTDEERRAVAEDSN